MVYIKYYKNTKKNPQMNQEFYCFWTDWAVRAVLTITAIWGSPILLKYPNFESISSSLHTIWEKKRAYLVQCALPE